MAENFGNIIVFGRRCWQEFSHQYDCRRQAADISSGATGCTFQHQAYELPVHDRNFTIYDTAGLNEGDRGTVNRAAAMAALYKLITGLDGGINLLVLHARAKDQKSYARKLEGVPRNHL